MTEESEFEVIGGDTIRQITAAEIDVQIATARKFPIDKGEAIQRARNMALSTPAVAEQCFYNLPRGDGIEGASARLAEILASNWGNIRAGARVIEIGEKQITAQGVAHDLESNNAVTVEVKRRITDKNGKRFNDDMITVTGNAACSIAYRNAVFKCIPKPLWEPIYEECKRVAKESVGKSVKDVLKRFEAALGYFEKFGVGREDVLRALGKKSEGDIDADDIQKLIGFKNAIDDQGPGAVETIFPKEAGPEQGFGGEQEEFGDE